MTNDESMTNNENLSSAGARRYSDFAIFPENISYPSHNPLAWLATPPVFGFAFWDFTFNDL